MSPTARSLDSLAIVDGITAAFHPAGAGHHSWQLCDQFGSVLARTERVHNGGKVAQAFWKLISATGLDANNDIHVNLVGAEGIPLASASSSYMKETVNVFDPAERQIAHSKRDKKTLTLFDADRCEIAALTYEGDGPWPVRNPAGDVLGELLAGQPGPSLTPELWHWIDPKWALVLLRADRTRAAGTGAAAAAVRPHLLTASAEQRARHHHTLNLVGA
ncbi:MAG: hypothetical protein QOD39_3848, partial [Mycobacterium sp.]|nr:hypothetical protein [Mycobacterium sp.]